MTRSAGSKHAGAALRAGLKHPIVDADAHVLECEFAMIDSLREVAGAKMAARFEKALGQFAMQRWYHASEATRRKQRIGRPSFWHAPAGTRDRATAMLPGLMRERLDEFGIDYAVVYTTLGLSFIHMRDLEMRVALCRALNKLNADTFREHRVRMTPAALIPMHTPEAAIEEIEYAVNTLGLKAITVSGHEWRPMPDGQPGRYADYLALDSEYDYDPVWKKCVALGVVPTSHVGTYGGPTHGSISNYTFNHAGHFAAGADMFCRALILGGVPKRFPKLKVAFLEGGVGWASMLYNSLVERFEKRNIKELLRSLDPARTDRNKMGQLFRKYGGAILSAKADLLAKGEGLMLGQKEDRAYIDDFAACGVSSAKALAGQFVNSFYFGCEGEDRMTAVAFDRRFNHYGAQLNAIFSSDLGHWDVPDMAEVLPETYELVEHGMLNEADFRKFVFGNVVEMYTAMNPRFFAGTSVEAAVEKERAGTARSARKAA